MHVRALALVLACVPAVATAGPCAGFLDVDDSSSFCADVTWVRNRGITLGCAANLYCPSADVSRLQMAALLHRLGDVTFQQGGNAFGAAGVIGTTDNHALDVHAGNARAMRYEPNAISPNVIGGHQHNAANSGVRGAAIGGGGVSPFLADPDHGAGTPNRVTDNYGTVGGGYANRAGDNAGTTTDRPFATVGGGSGNTASGTLSTVGGGFAGAASGDFSTIAGGRDNTASAAYGTIGGGEDQLVTGGYGTVGGGRNHTASGDFSTVGGGFGNIASGFGNTVGGGENNQASASYSSIGGGKNNVAGGIFSTIAGGAGNTAVGRWSSAGGTLATAGEDGMFVWADSRIVAFDPAAYRPPGHSINTFNVRATGIGGVYFALAVDAMGAPTWACYAQNGGGWTCTSDANAKQTLGVTDGTAVLEKVAAIPIYHWQPRAGPNREALRLGPTAQDFHAAFGLGNDALAINSQDADGVALAAIQGLNTKLKRTLDERDAMIAELRGSLAEVLVRLDKLEARRRQ